MIFFSWENTLAITGYNFPEIPSHYLWIIRKILLTDIAQPLFSLKLLISYPMISFSSSWGSSFPIDYLFPTLCNLHKKKKGQELQKKWGNGFKASASKDFQRGRAGKGNQQLC